MKKVTLSVALAVFNEEKNITACLKSVRQTSTVSSVEPLADEIVVVDGGSTDKTVLLAKKLGAKIIETDNPPIFHLNKQKAIDACQSDWILQLDADEQISEPLGQEILQKIHRKEINGYWLPRKNFFLGRFLTKGGQYPDYTLRLYRKGKGRLPCQSVHEQAVVEGRTAYLKNDLLHYPYPNFEEYLHKAIRYAQLFAAEYKKQGVGVGVGAMIKYLFLIPKLTFLKIYFRHRGFVDGFAGLVFALYSGIVRLTAYVIYWEKRNES
jgi:glycosyltransferase involved in cell wall biosynthesis